MKNNGELFDGFLALLEIYEKVNTELIGGSRLIVEPIIDDSIIIEPYLTNKDLNLILTKLKEVSK